MCGRPTRVAVKPQYPLVILRLTKPHVVNNDAPNVDLPPKSDAFFDTSDASGAPDEHENDPNFDNSDSLVDICENTSRNLANPEYSVSRFALSNKRVPPSRSNKPYSSINVCRLLHKRSNKRVHY